MPNYRYNSPDYMRRNSCGRGVPATQPAPACQGNVKPVCCDDRAAYDELNGMPLAMAYVPWQEWCAIYEAEKGFCRGTIFEELDKPFRGIGGCCK